MPLRHTYPFRIVRGTTAPSFNSTANLTPQLLALESTALARVWAGPSGRAIRVAESSGLDYRINFGSSLISAAGSSDSILVLGGTVETFHVEPGQTYISVHSVNTSTHAEVNITLGYGE
jgi:hypothetical protein